MFNRELVIGIVIGVVLYWAFLKFAPQIGFGKKSG